MHKIHKIQGYNYNRRNCNSFIFSGIRSCVHVTQGFFLCRFKGR
nr:MAG TPA: hypothetical protein [Bacteriophage sp.]